MLSDSLDAFIRADGALGRQVCRDDDVVDSLHEAIKLYLIRASKADLTEGEARRYVEILTFNTNLEHIGDISCDVVVVDNESHDGVADMVATEYPQARTVWSRALVARWSKPRAVVLGLVWCRWPWLTVGEGEATM